jgi:hypothetical protein
MATRKIGDPKWRGPTGATLEVVAKSRDAHSIFVLATENEYRRPKPTRVFAARVQMRGGDDWERLRVKLEDFQPLEGEGSLKSWDDVNLLTLESQHQVRAPQDAGSARWLGEAWEGPLPAIGRIAWVPPESPTGKA